MQGTEHCGPSRLAVRGPVCECKIEYHNAAMTFLEQTTHALVVCTELTVNKTLLTFLQGRCMTGLVPVHAGSVVGLLLTTVFQLRFCVLGTMRFGIEDAGHDH